MAPDSRFPRLYADQASVPERRRVYITFFMGKCVMNYRHETISGPDQQKIVHDVSPKFSRLYASRRGYFEERVLFPVWVVDRQEN